jgi:hypothetical protein
MLQAGKTGTEEEEEEDRNAQRWLKEQGTGINSEYLHTTDTLD